MSCGGNLVLTHIPRYANFTDHYVSAKGVNTITMYWSADKGVNACQYSVNGGGWQDCNGNNTYVIGNLEPNTSYNVRTRIRASDSGLWAESAVVSVTTYDIARISEFSEVLELGESYVLKYNSLSSASIKVGIFNETGESVIVDYRDCVSNTYSFNFTQDEIDRLYVLCGTSNKYVARLCLQTKQNDKVYVDYKYVTVKLTGKVNSVTIKIGEVIKKGRVWVGTSAKNKAGVFVVGTFSGNRRGV